MPPQTASDLLIPKQSFSFIFCFWTSNIKILPDPSCILARALLLLSALAALTSLTFVSGAPSSMPNKVPASPRTVRMPIAKKSRNLSRRGSIEADLSNEVNAYFVETQIGTPPQSVTIKLDTGSSDTFAFSPAGCSADSCYGGSCESIYTFSFPNLQTRENVIPIQQPDSD